MPTLPPASLHRMALATKEAGLSRVIVCGSRGWTDSAKIAERLAALPKNTLVVHGGARGADKIAAREATKLGLKVQLHGAKWERYGKTAGLIRNHEMAAAGADLCLAFWDNRSSGTKHMIAEARKHGIPVEIIKE